MQAIRKLSFESTIQIIKLTNLLSVSLNFALSYYVAGAALDQLINLTPIRVYSPAAIHVFHPNMGAGSISVPLIRTYLPICMGNPVFFYKYTYSYRAYRSTCEM